MATEDFEQLQKLGAPAPPGTPEYEAWAAEDLRKTMLIVVWLFLSLCYVFVGLRLWARLRVYRHLLADDLWLVAGLASGLLSATFATVAVDYGNGRHMAVLSQEAREGVILWTTAAFCPGILFFGLPKVAIVTLLIRLLNPQRWLQWFLWGIVCLSQAAFIVLIGLILGRCDPPKKMWKTTMEGECMPIKHVTDFALFAGAISAFVDVVLAVYPAIVFSQLQLTLKRKVGLSAALGIGSIGGAIAIYKTAIIPDGLGNPDFSYHSTNLMIWTAVEGSTIMIAASLPILAPVLDMAANGYNPFARLKRSERSYRGLGLTGSHEMNSVGYKHGGSAERALGAAASESQVDILAMGKEVSTDSSGSPQIGSISDRNAAPSPGPGQILVSSEINITYEKRPKDPLMAMIRGYDTRGW